MRFFIGVPQCPDGEDESQEQCNQGEDIKIQRNMIHNDKK